MNYKIVINIPNEKNATEVLISEEQLNVLQGELNSKRLVKINGSYFNTTYIAKIIPDIEANAIEAPKFVQLEEVTDSTRIKNAGEELDKLKSKLFKK